MQTTERHTLRIYPNTTTPENLERLAGVPAGTFQNLKEIKERTQGHLTDRSQFRDYFHANDAFWQTIREPGNSAARALNVFDYNGFGELHHGEIPKEVLENGGTTDPVMVNIILSRHGVPALGELCEGLHWR